MNQDYLDCICVENMRESDRLTIARFCSGRTLMYRAALGVFRAVTWDGRTAIAVGGGNNGGDGYALACILARNGHPCRIVKLSEKLTEESAYYAKQAAELGVPMEPYAPACLRPLIPLWIACWGQAFRAACGNPGAAPCRKSTPPARG